MSRKKLTKSIFIIFSSAIFFFSATTMVENYLFDRWARQMKNNEAFLVKTKTPTEHKTLSQDGYNIHYFVSGDSTSDILVFLHPAFVDHHCFDKQVNFFSKSYRVITLDLIGHGLSQVQRSKDKIDSSVEHLKAILEKEGYEKAHFIGVSMGALIAQYFALNYPEMVHSLTIVGGYDINEKNTEIAKAQRTEGMKWMLKALFSMDSFRRYAASATVIKPESQAHFYDMMSRYTRKSFLVMSGLSNIIMQREATERSYPLLIMCGDNDLELAVKVSKSFHEKEAGSEFHLIQDAGHCANMDNDVEFNNLLTSFIAKNL